MKYSIFLNFNYLSMKMNWENTVCPSSFFCERVEPLAKFLKSKRMGLNDRAGQGPNF